MKLYINNGWGGKIWFVGLDAEKTMDQMWEELDTLKEQERSPALIREDTRFRLDPGGLLCTTIKFIKFTVDGVDFEIQPHRADHVKWLLENGTEKIEGIVCIPLWTSYLMLPRKLRDSLVIKLGDVSLSSAALHASITLSEAKEKANENPFNMYINGPVDVGGGKTIDINELKKQRKNRKEEL